MSNRKYFGTDGIRGRVGDAPITPEFVLKLGWAAGKVLARHGSRKIIIGKDTRISGYMLESALEAGLAAAGLSASFTGPMPTPAIAYLTRAFRAEATDCVCPREQVVCVCGHRARFRILTKKPVMAGEEEVQDNSRARSAKLRVAERLPDAGADVAG